MASTRSASASSNRGRGSRAAAKTSAAAGAAQHANEANLSQQPQGGTGTTAPAPTPQAQAPGAPAQQTNDANLRVPHVAHEALVRNIKGADASFKAAINLEIAVACAVFIDFGGTDLSAKKELMAVYADAGYDCKVGGEGKDYKTVSRRMGYAVQFYNSLEKDALKNVMGEARDDAAIQTLVAHIAGKYNFRSMNDVLLASGVTPPSRAPRTPGGDNGQQGGGSGGNANEQAGQSVFKTSATTNPTGVPQGQPSEGDKGVLAAMEQAAGQREQGRREQDDPSKWVKVMYEGATIVLPADMKTECLFQMGMKLVQAANEMHGATTIVAAALNEQFKELAAAH